ncbi:hypothetical protein AYI68_g3108 [Smittium mucronatum]|uniref:mRNA-decapping enzyme 1B n=1 Tax=Smittium mucronatum TaxID=133383 RepID=A0A1R0H0V4_9FUNG|nr:hypothetical protein AYI68_g3108 [Smittium mucronatum]
MYKRSDGIPINFLYALAFLPLPPPLFNFYREKIQIKTLSFIIYFKEKVFGLWVYEEGDIERICKQLSICSVKSIDNVREKKVVSEYISHKPPPSSNPQAEQGLDLQQRIKNMLQSNNVPAIQTQTQTQTQPQTQPLAVRNNPLQPTAGTGGQIFSLQEFFETVSKPKTCNELKAEPDPNHDPSTNHNSPPSSRLLSQSFPIPPDPTVPASNLMQKLGALGIQVQNTPPNSFSTVNSDSSSSNDNNLTFSNSRTIESLLKNSQNKNSLGAPPNNINMQHFQDEPITLEKHISSHPNSKHDRLEKPNIGAVSKSSDDIHIYNRTISENGSQKKINGVSNNLTPENRNQNKTNGVYSHTIPENGNQKTSGDTSESEKSSIAHQSAMELISFLNKSLAPPSQIQPINPPTSYSTNTHNQPLLSPVQSQYFYAPQPKTKNSKNPKPNVYKNPSYPQNRSATVAPLKSALFNDNSVPSNAHYSPRSIYPPF